MAYTINKTNGSIFATVADGTINTSSSITIIGKNYAGYGEFLGENFIKMLENSANSTAPTAPLTGQLWYDSGNNLLKVYSGSQWKNLGAATSSSSTPTGNVAGDLWFDSTNSQLKVYDGSSFVLVGPAFTSGTGTSGAIVDTVRDSGGIDHIVVKLYVENDIVATVSKDSTFTPQTSITGFANIASGIQLSTTVDSGNALFTGKATNAAQLDGFSATDYLSAVANDTTVGSLGILNDSGLTVGVDSDFQITTPLGTGNVILDNLINNGDIIFRVNDGGSTTQVLVFDGATSDILPGVGGTTNLGASGTKFNNVYANSFEGTATSAEYADLAERFEADAEYEAGTVVELGGIAEITKAVEELSENVFGVISDRAAYLMNAKAGSNATHPPIAMNGRVPVKVIGTVNKGDRLVSAGNGFARAAQDGEATARNIIGRALTNKETTGEGTVEAVVKINF